MAEVRYSLIIGFPGYRAGEDGSLWSCWRFKGGGYGRPGKWAMSGVWKRIKPDIRKSDGRKRYTLRQDAGEYVKRYGSNFVLLAFVGPRPEGMEACHNNGDCTDDSLGNVRWDTPVNNKADMKRHGTDLSGDRNGNAKLNWPIVRDVRRRVAAGETRKIDIARELDVSPTLVGYIIANKIWKEKDGNARDSAVAGNA